MNKKSFLLSIMLLAMPAMLLANPITEAEAKQQAAKFLAQRMHSGDDAHR